MNHSNSKDYKSFLHQMTTLINKIYPANEFKIPIPIHNITLYFFISYLDKIDPLL